MCAIDSFMRLLAHAFLLTCALNEAFAAAEFVKENRVVCISQGCLEGTTLPGYQTEAYEAFLGIPFAEPPVGELRFAVRLILPTNIHSHT